MSRETRCAIAVDADIVTARQSGRSLAAELGFSAADQALIATAISEVARNILIYARQGEVVISVAEKPGRRGIAIVARDDGPGIDDIALAMQDGYSTAKGLGLGLPGAKRMTDEFEIASARGQGTVITMRKWVHGE